MSLTPEEAQIVAWLRAEQIKEDQLSYRVSDRAGRVVKYGATVLRTAANAIERGEHRNTAAAKDS